MAMLTIWQLSSKAVSKDLQEWFADWVQSNNNYGPNFIQTVSGWKVKDAQWTAILDELTSPGDIETFINIYFMCCYKDRGFSNYEACYKSIKNAREAIVKICMEVGFDRRQNPFHGFFAKFGGWSNIEFTFKNIAELNNALVDRSIEWDELSVFNLDVSILFCKEFYKKSNLDQYLKERGELGSYNKSGIPPNINGGNIARVKEWLTKSEILTETEANNVKVTDKAVNYFKVAIFTGKWEDVVSDKWETEIRSLNEIRTMIYDFKDEFLSSSTEKLKLSRKEEVIKDQLSKIDTENMEKAKSSLVKIGVNKDNLQSIQDAIYGVANERGVKLKEKLEKKNNGK